MEKNKNQHMLAYLKESRTLGQLPDELLVKLISLGSRFDYSAGKTILQENSKNNQLYILIEGVVSIHSNGEFIVKLKRRGDIFGEMSLITGEISSASVMADTPIELLAIKAQDIGQFDLFDVKVLENIFFRIFSRTLTEKLALTTQKARQHEIANRQLLETQKKLEQANAEALRAVQAKSAFLAMMSHEIRTPLNSIIGNTELLYYTDLTKGQEKHLNTIYRSGELLLSIIHNILDFSMIEANELKLEYHRFDLKTLLAEIGEMFANEAARKGIELKIQYDHTAASHFIGDRVRIRQIIVNLLGNAIKFTSNGHVRLSLDMIEVDTTNNQLQIRIEDTGIGIPEEKSLDIFEGFTQADVSTTRKFGGTGIGLAICKRLVSLMGGDIGVDSQEGMGSTFWIRLSLPSVDDDMPA